MFVGLIAKLQMPSFFLYTSLLLILPVIVVYYFCHRRLDSASLPRTVDTSSRARDDHIAVIIPALNEGDRLAATIERLFNTANDENEPTVVVVYVGPELSLDSSKTIHPTLHLIRYPEPPSRGAQLNFGVAHAIAVSPESSLLLFLHADTFLQPGWDDIIRTTIIPSPSSSSLHPPALGAFSLSLSPPISLSLRLMLWGANLRARWGGLPYGDQGYFLTLRVFESVGGFPSVPIMEDVELLRRVARVGRIAVIDEIVETSDRRWRQKGVFWNTILNQVLLTAWMCGVSYETIYQVYYGRRGTARLRSR